MARNSLQIYLFSIYGGTPIDLKPRSSFFRPFFDFFRKLKRENNVAVAVFSDMKEKELQRNLKMGDGLIEDFKITDLKSTPSFNEVSQSVLAYLFRSGYTYCSKSGGRTQILKNDSGDSFILKIFVGNNYFSVKFYKANSRRRD